MDFAVCTQNLINLESLGDNCEIGFVFDRIGHKAGGLFRWTAMSPRSLLAMLKGRFEHLYDFENLMPSYDDMVVESRYNIYWHTEMFSHIVDGQRVFRMGEDERRAIHAREVEKRIALVAKFLERLRSGQAIYVIKANSGIDPALLAAIESELASLAEGAHFEMLLMRFAREGEEPGTLSKTGPHHGKARFRFLHLTIRPINTIFPLGRPC